jgi:SLOG cluster4 family
MLNPFGCKAFSFKNIPHVTNNRDMAIITDLGYAGNNINVLTSPVTIAWGIGSDTASEIAWVEK